MNEMRIKKIEDKDEIKGALEVARDLEHTDQEGLWFDPKAIPNIRKSFEKENAFIAVYDYKVVGFATFKKKSLFSNKNWELTWIGVKKEHHNKDLKVGSRLMDEVIKEVKKEGGRYLFVETVSPTEKETGRKLVDDSLRAYKKTRSFYRHKGFEYHKGMSKYGCEMAEYKLEIK